MKKCLEMQCIIVLLVPLLSPALAPAQNETPLSLTEAVERALKHNRGLKASEKQTEASQSGVGQAKAAFFPRLDVVENFNYSDKPTLVFSNLLDQANFKQRNFAVSSLNEPTPLTNLSSQVRLEQPIYTGGRLSANLSQAKAAAEVSRQRTKRTEQEVVLSVVEAYYRVLLAERNLGIVQKALESAQAQVQRTKDLYEKGLAVRADYLRTQVLMGSLERERLEAENSITINHSRLRHALGVEEGRFHLTDRVIADNSPVEELSLLKARAKEFRPDLKAAVKEVERSSESIRAARASYYPSLGLVTQFESNTRKLSSSGESFAVFVTARWNLFSGFAAQEKVSEEEALHKRAELLRDDLQQRVTLEVEKAYLGLIASRKQVTVARENVAQAQEALRITTDRYMSGLARNVDVLDGETALKRAQQDLLLARVNSQIFRARLNLATGQ